MTENEKFLDRWSRRKRGIADDPAPRHEEGAIKKDAATPPECAPAPETQDADAAKPFDLVDLPSIKSISADTDVRDFLRPGVPEELTRAALRRAWSTDPAIRDFVGLVENGWDFNDPSAMPGFGPITAEEAARLLAQAIGLVTPDTRPEEASQAAVAEEATASATLEVPQASDEQTPTNEASPQCDDRHAASQNKTDA